MAKEFEALVEQIYQEQLGREPDEGGLKFWSDALANGAPVSQVLAGINQSVEGQNYDTQYITSLYRQILGRNPEQEGFQYWLSEAQSLGYTPDQIRSILGEAALVEQGQRGITGQTFTNLQLPDLEADPYGGRYLTQSIYDLLPDAVNVSSIGGRQAQFVAPVTQQPVISQYTTGGNQGFSATTGLDVLSAPAVQSAINRALASGAMTDAEYRTMFSDLQKAQNMTDVYAAFNKPQAQVVIDAVFGQQTGEANTLAQAQAEAAQRQNVLNALGSDFYMSNPVLAQAYQDAGLYYPFTEDMLGGYDTRTTQANVVTDANFNRQLGNVLTQLYGRFGGAEDMVTPLTGQYYSETGLQPGYTPIGTEGTMFRSGVAGYTPNLPSMFQFGMPPVDTSFQQYRPGAFQPEGVTTGGYITGYTQAGAPIYSTYANPNVNVGGQSSALIPFNAQQQQQLADAYNYVQAQQAAQSLALQGASVG
jgi:hypothetical protein